MTIVLIVLAVVVIVIAAVLIRAATMPTEFRVMRSTTIAASVDTVFPLIDDLHAMNQWNPFAKEMAADIVYTGPVSGKGAGFRWDSKGRGGTGSMETLDSDAGQSVTLRLDMLKPMEGHNTVVFTLVPMGSATSVNWTMFGPWPYLHRIFAVAINMDKMIGGAFEKGLLDLKALAESRTSA